jgi:hypothetical protein
MFHVEHCSLLTKDFHIGIENPVGLGGKFEVPTCSPQVALLVHTRGALLVDRTDL